MANERFPVCIVPQEENDAKPKLLAELLPHTENRIPMCVGAVYDRIRRPGLPYYVRSRVMPKFEPTYGLYDSNLGVVTSPDYPQTRARYSQEVFSRLQRGNNSINKSLLAQVYAVATLVVREITSHPQIENHIESGPIYPLDDKSKLIRRAGWQAASRLAIEVVVADKSKQDDIVQQMRFVERELEWDYQNDSLAGYQLAREFDPESPRSFSAPVEIVASVSPFSKAELKSIFPIN